MSIRGGAVRRTLLALLASLLLAETGSAALVSAATKPAVLTAVLPGPLSGCDPVGSTVSPAAAQVLSLVLPRPTLAAPSGSLTASDSVFVQSEVTNLSPLTIDYQLRRGATWSDGSRIGLADFLATVRRGAQGSSPAAAQYRLVRSVRQGANRHHVVVVFRTPSSAWQSLFSPLMAASTSSSALRECSSPSAAADISAGPYVIATSSPSQIILVRNPRWLGRGPTFPWISVAGSHGRSTVVPTAPGPLVVERAWMTSDTLAALSSSASLSSQVNLSNRLLSLNFRTRGGPTASVMVRQAIAHFIDRQSLVAAGAQTLDPKVAVAGSNLLSQGQPGYTGPPARSLGTPATTSSTTTTLPDTKPTGDVLARQDLRRGGWHQAGGQWIDRHRHVLRLRLAVAIDDRWAVSTARDLAAQLAAVHIGTTIVRGSSAPAVAEDLRAGRVELGVLARPTDPFLAHAAAWFSVPSAGPASALWAGYSDKSVNQLVQQAATILNPVDALTLYQQVGRRLWVMMPTLPLYTEPFVTAWSSQISGVIDNPYGPGTLSAASSWVIIPASSTP